MFVLSVFFMRVRISYGNSVHLSVCLSVCHDPVPFHDQLR